MNNFRRKSEAGQSLVEVVVGIAIAGFLIVGAVTAISASLKSDVEGQAFQVGPYLSQELATNVAAFSKANWLNISNLARDPNKFYLVGAGEGFGVTSGQELIGLNGVNFTRYFTVASTSRDGNSDIEAVYQAVNEDKSTLKVVTITTWLTSTNQTATSSLTRYLTRHRNEIFSQTDWSGDVITPLEIVVLPNNSYTKFFAETNIATSTIGEIYIDGL